jgi:hypothetical protein
MVSTFVLAMTSERVECEEEKQSFGYIYGANVSEMERVGAAPLNHKISK